MRAAPLFVCSLVAAGLAACGPTASSSGSGPSLATQGKALGRAARPVRRDPAALAAMAGGVASSDRFIWAVGDHPASADATPAEAARAHLAKFLPAHGAAPRDLEITELRALHDLGPNGYVAWFAQRVNGVDVYPSEVRLLLRPDLSLVAVADRLPAVAAGVPAFRPRVSMADVLSLTVTDILQFPVTPEEVVTLEQVQGDFQYFGLVPGSEVHLPAARMKPIYFVRDSGVEAAYFVELYAGMAADVDSEAFRYIVSARTGEILDRRDLTFSQSFDYRVWAPNSGDFRPADGPISDYTPHPTGTPDNSEPTLVNNPTLVRIPGGFNTNPLGTPDPWLPGSAAQTVGNNIDAYTDDNAPDGYSNDDLRATTTSNRTFDRVFDLGRGPVDDELQRMASVTSLFFVTNWMHDYWYDSGFDEAAGNAQQNNYGRGGVGGDVMRAEAQDGHFAGSRNNANMSTPSDGLSPRMQMYTWTGVAQQSVTYNGTAVGSNSASFGPQTFDVTAALVLADDGAGVSTDACQPLVNNVAGRIVLVDRGACAFVTKTLNAQAAGASGVILANDRAGNPPGMGGTAAGITIGTVSVTQGDGAAMQAALLAGPVSATIRRATAVDRDGSLDYMVVAHEWGHYLHNRLADCGTVQCRGMGEGWADFVALHTVLRPGDDLDGTYAMGIWATRGRPQASYYGIRRVPYSVDPAKNALSLRHIQDGETLPTHPLDPSGANSQVHNTGEVWASMLFEGYVALLRPTETSTATDFAQVRRRYADYIVAGLMITPRNATFTEQRDAILAAAAARSPTDLDTIARAFARRGSGTCAVAPASTTPGNVGVTEATTIQPVISLGAITVDDSVWSCDQDGVLDAEEQGLLRFEIANGGPVTAVSTQVTVTSTTPGLIFPGGTTFTVPSIPPYRTETVTLPVEVAAGLTGTATLTVALRAANPDACAPTITSTVVARFNIDEIGGQTKDDVEATSSPWNVGGAQGTQVWSREATAPFQTAWRGVDFARTSDTWLESPTLEVGTANFVIELQHRYRFEADAADGSRTNWDGGVIEISGDDGATWEDMVTYVNPGYRGTLTDRSGNPLADREALVGTSTAWPNRQRLVLDLGTNFASRQVKLRFRIGTDQSVGDFGWEIDDVAVQGLLNAPFFTIGGDQTQCPIRLVADAGDDRVVNPEELITLDGTESTSAESLPLTFAWVQTAGPQVTLTETDTPTPRWIAPALPGTAVLRFELTVEDGTRMATDEVDITVVGTPAPVARAGADQQVGPGEAVLLDGSASSYDVRIPASFAWTQTSGPDVTLSNPAAVTVGFAAPVMETASTLEFLLTLNDGTRTSTDTVTVEVEATPALEPLVAVAGPDRTVEDEDVVVLDGSASTGDPRLPVTLSWTQVSGPTVSFVSNTADTAVFVAEGEISETVVLSFELTAADGRRTETDTVQVTIAALPAPPPPPAPLPEDEGCTCAAPSPQPGSAPWLGLSLLLGGFAVAIRRRRG